MPDHVSLDGLLDELDGLALRPALDLVRACAEADGIDLTVSRLLAGAQREVGRRWELDRWTIAQEHAATAIVDAALAQLHLWADEHTRPSGPHLALVCAEGEWHVTPARMAALRFQVRGWRVTFLGASTPADHLARTLDELRPDVVGVSCTLPVHLPGARRVVQTAHADGFPVVAGGAALGDDDRRARAIGADGGGGDLDELEMQARRWLDCWVRPAVPSPPPSTEVARLVRVGPTVIEAALADVVAVTDTPVGTPQDRTREDLRWILRFVAASVDVDDPRVVQDFLTWVEGVLVVRGVPPRALVAGLDALARHLDDDLHAAHHVLAAGRTWVRDRVWEPSVA